MSNQTQQIRTIFILTLLSIGMIPISCNIYIPQELPTTSETLNSTHTLIPEISPTSTIALTDKPIIAPTIEGGQIGGITGVYAPTKPLPPPPSSIGYLFSYDFFRFYEDGLVIGVLVASNGLIHESWIDIQTWFNKNHNNVAKGIYYTYNSHIWFNMSNAGNMLATDYSGIISESTLILNYYNRRDNSRGESIEYSRLDLEFP